MKHQINQDETLENAKELAQKIYKTLEFEDKDRYQRAIMEGLLMLSPDRIPDFTVYEGLSIELACLLADTDISSKLDEKYYQKNAGKILKRMISFFGSLERNEEIQKYLIWYNLQHFSGRLDERELGDISEYVYNSYLK